MTTFHNQSVQKGHPQWLIFPLCWMLQLQVYTMQGRCLNVLRFATENKILPSSYHNRSVFSLTQLSVLLTSFTNKVTRSALSHSFSSLLKDLHGIIFFKTSAVPGTGRTISGHAVLNAETSHHFLFAHGFIQIYVDKTKTHTGQFGKNKRKSLHTEGETSTVSPHVLSTFNATSFQSSKDRKSLWGFIQTRRIKV